MIQDRTIAQPLVVVSSGSSNCILAYAYFFYNTRRVQAERCLQVMFNGSQCHGLTLPQNPFSLRPPCPHGTQLVLSFLCHVRFFSAYQLERRAWLRKAASFQAGAIMIATATGVASPNASWASQYCASGEGEDCEAL